MISLLESADTEADAGEVIDDGVDSDNDTLPDVYENDLGTNPAHPDTDKDGFSDGFEVNSGFDPLSAASVPPAPFGRGRLARGAPLADGSTDSDRDGLPNLYEEEFGTDPALKDSDGDGSFDGIEILNGTSPLDPSSFSTRDSDGDGLADSAERKHGANASLADSDLDSLSDPNEILLGFDPRDPDTDDDGVLDGYQVGGNDYLFQPRGWHVNK